MNSIIFSLNKFSRANRLALSFLLVFFFIIISDFASNFIFYKIVPSLKLSYLYNIDLSFAPEVWAAIIALIIGTLIIVIALASENTPELMDIFINEWINLIYVWFLILCSLHSIYSINVLSDISRASSGFLNTFIFLPIASIASLPFIFRTLLRSKDVNVVRKISTILKSTISSLKKESTYNAMNQNEIVSHYQNKIFKTIDQLDNLLLTLSSRRARSIIINELGDILRFYSDCKSKINNKFFIVTDTIINDITYKTRYTEESLKTRFDEFYEFKIYAIFASNYSDLLDKKDYSLASSIPSEITRIGRFFISSQLEHQYNDLNIMMNTLWRYSIKNAIKFNEPRYLYNLCFHHGNLLREYIKSNNYQMVEDSYDKFEFYAQNIYKEAEKNNSLYFIIDSMSSELKKCQELIYNLKWGKKKQLALLNVMFRLDVPPNYNKEKIDDSLLGANNGTRRIQLGLALFYLSVGEVEYVDKIARDYLKDLQFFDKETFKKNLDKQCYLLSIFGPDFWESNDRGSINIYYSAHKKFIEDLKTIITNLLNLEDTSS